MTKIRRAGVVLWTNPGTTRNELVIDSQYILRYEDGKEETKWFCEMTPEQRRVAVTLSPYMLQEREIA